MAEPCAERAERPAEGLAEGAWAHPGWRRAAAHEARSAATSAPSATPIADMVEAAQLCAAMLRGEALSGVPR
jgi:hypothetical protein